MRQVNKMRMHPLHSNPKNDPTDYTERNRNFIEILKALEIMTDLDAHILDYQNNNILYITKGSLLRRPTDFTHAPHVSLERFNEAYFPEEYETMAEIFSKTLDFLKHFSPERIQNGYVTLNHRVKQPNGSVTMVNQKASIIDLAIDGSARLELCTFTLPTSDKPNTAYIKMLDTGSVYEYMPVSGKFVEVKTQKLTSKANEIIRLASLGRTEAEMADLLGISVSTVKYHKQKIFSQTGTRNIAEAIQWTHNQKKIVNRKKR